MTKGKQMPLGRSDSQLRNSELARKISSGVEHAGVIDLFAFDQKSGEVLLVMNEARPWDGSDLRLHQLQEKFNAYASFLLDGEMAEEHPKLVGKPARIELRCTKMPDDQTIALLGAMRDQLALQEIRVEVVVSDPDECGSECSCQRGENEIR